MSGPLPKFRVIVAFDRHRVGDLIEPTGILRDQLLGLKFIERVGDLPALLQLKTTEAAPARRRRA
jgi:hypothetical protein